MACYADVLVVGQQPPSDCALPRISPPPRLGSIISINMCIISISITTITLIIINCYYHYYH